MLSHVAKINEFVCSSCPISKTFSLFLHRHYHFANSIKHLRLWQSRYCIILLLTSACTNSFSFYSWTYWTVCLVLGGWKMNKRFFFLNQRPVLVISSIPQQVCLFTLKVFIQMRCPWALQFNENQTQKSQTWERARLNVFFYFKTVLNGTILTIISIAKNAVGGKNSCV